ncbi:MAG TPA: 2Fe-2S iron-sulfur cluster-binding protein [Planctomycetota bacterium]|nr:2Fe-2S iron-sulfur cluster-binding protein [Planctomycetota bacterium]
MTVEVRFQNPDGSEKVVIGKPGQNLLEIALYNDIEVDHACGGVCACSTCHIKVESGAAALSEAQEDEEDQLDDARDLSLESRLACQARIVQGASGTIVVAIPAWNVNAAKEGQH